MAACPTVQPVQNSGHHALGFVDFRSAVYIDELLQRTPIDDRVSWVLRRSASLCAVDTHWDSQASVLRGGSERLEWHCRFRNASSLSTFHAKLKTHFTVAYCTRNETNIPPISASVYWLLVDIIGSIQIILHYMHVNKKHVVLWTILLLATCISYCFLSGRLSSASYTVIVKVGKKSKDFAS